MAAKLQEYVVEVNGIETGMMLDSEDADRYEKAGMIKKKGSATQGAKTSDVPAEDSDTENAQTTDKATQVVQDKAMKSPSNK